MWERMANGWTLAKESWNVLRCDKELLLFPLMSGIACLLVLASFAVPLWASGYVETILANEGEERGPLSEVLGYVLLFAFYFVNYFVIVFFNTALISCAIIRFKGGNPNLRDGFSSAIGLLPQIVAWAAVAATVGVVLKLIESRSEKVGQFVTSLLGMGWSIVTYFVVPVIVVEQANPMRAVKRSAAVIRRTWGEALVANFGIGMFVFLACLVAFVPIAVGGFAMVAGQTVLGAAMIAVGIVALLVISLVSSALDAIILAALYLYAAEKAVPQQFSDQLFRDAFAKK
jgi:hypothetical protein